MLNLPYLTYTSLTHILLGIMLGVLDLIPGSSSHSYCVESCCGMLDRPVSLALCRLVLGRARPPSLTYCTGSCWSVLDSPPPSVTYFAGSFLPNILYRTMLGRAGPPPSITYCAGSCWGVLDLLPPSHTVQYHAGRTRYRPFLTYCAESYLGVSNSSFSHLLCRIMLVRARPPRSLIYNVQDHAEVVLALNPIFHTMQDDGAWSVFSLTNILCKIMLGACSIASLSHIILCRIMLGYARPPPCLTNTMQDHAGACSTASLTHILCRIILGRDSPDRTGSGRINGSDRIGPDFYRW